jgi:hypothetical protein
MLRALLNMTFGFHPIAASSARECRRTASAESG